MNGLITAIEEEQKVKTPRAKVFLEKQKKGKNNQNPLWGDFAGDPDKTGTIKCPGCKCHGIVQKLLSEDELKE